MDPAETPPTNCLSLPHVGYSSSAEWCGATWTAGRKWWVAPSDRHGLVETGLHRVFQPKQLLEGDTATAVEHVEQREASCSILNAAEDYAAVMGGA